MHFSKIIKDYSHLDVCRHVLFLCIFLLLNTPNVNLRAKTVNTSLDAQSILVSTDMSRGANLPGISMLVHIYSETSKGKPDSDSSVTLKVMTHNGLTRAEIVDPPHSKGMLLLLAHRNMWLFRPGMNKPVAVSARQRLSGQASLGDIATTEYARQYKASYLREEFIDGEPYYVLELKSSESNTTYNRIIYWVSERSGFGMRADFLSLSGKLIKHAEFQYNNKITLPNHNVRPFISIMKISDSLTSKTTTLKYSDIYVQSISPTSFDVNALQ